METDPREKSWWKMNECVHCEMQLKLLMAVHAVLNLRHMLIGVDLISCSTWDVWLGLIR